MTSKEFWNLWTGDIVINYLVGAKLEIFAKIFPIVMTLTAEIDIHAMIFGIVCPKRTILIIIASRLIIYNSAGPIGLKIIPEATEMGRIVIFKRVSRTPWFQTCQLHQAVLPQCRFIRMVPPIRFLIKIWTKISELEFRQGNRLESRSYPILQKQPQTDYQLKVGLKILLWVLLRLARSLSCLFVSWDPKPRKIVIRIIYVYWILHHPKT